MNSQKLCICTAAAATTPAALPSSAPSAKPARRPKRCMNSEAGISVTAEPTSVMAMGNVAKLGSGASSRPTTPDAVTTRTDTVWDRPCAVASSRTLRFSAVICCHDSSAAAGSSARPRQIPEQHVEPQPHAQVRRPVVRLVPAHDGLEMQVQPAILRRPPVEHADLVVLGCPFAFEVSLVLAERAQAPADADVVGRDIRAIAVRHDELAGTREHKGL